MNSVDEILNDVADMPAREKAAALAHAVYMHTAHKMGGEWKARVPDGWRELDEGARAFNLAAVDNWALMPEVFNAWIDAVKAGQGER